MLLNDGGLDGLHGRLVEVGGFRASLVVSGGGSLLAGGEGWGLRLMVVGVSDGRGLIKKAEQNARPFL